MATKEEIRGLLDFEDFYRGELPQLKPTSGGNYQALCPFHEDKDPSLSVNFKTGLFKCFGCDTKGDVFEFYMRRHGCDFKEALAALGRQVGVDSTVKPPGQYKSLTLKEFALLKKLPLDFLSMQGVGEYQYPPEVFDGCRTVNFPYKDKDAGKALSNRRRFAQAKERFKWKKGDRTRLYGLWKLPEIKTAGWCLLVEGESDALTCWLHGLPCLGLPGKKTWRSSRRNLSAAELQTLKDSQVYLWEEPDAGERNPKRPLEVLLRDEVVKDLPGLLVIPAPKEFKDLSEAHCQGKDIKLVVAELKKKARPPQPPPDPMEEWSLSDLGNSRRMVARHGQDLHYIHLAKKWYFYDGRRWRVDDCGEVERRAKQVVGEIYREAADADNLKRREVLGQHALRSEEARRIRAMVSLAQSEPGIPAAPRDFDADPWLFNCENGTVDLRTGESASAPPRGYDHAPGASPLRTRGAL